VIKPEELNKQRRHLEKEAVKFYKRLKKKPVQELEDRIRQLDHVAFEKINCLECANCCKTISPVFKERDIKRLADHLDISASEFVTKFLRIDGDGDYVLQSVPCPFLGENNYCGVYEFRPAACKGFPHTSYLPLKNLWPLITKNSAVCPAVHEITRILKKENQ
jgi:uncharacterized protein